MQTFCSLIKKIVLYEKHVQGFLYLMYNGTFIKMKPYSLYSFKYHLIIIQINLFVF